MGILSTIFGGAGTSLVEAVGDVIDKTTTSDEERKALDNELRKAEMQHETEMRALGIKETELYLHDTDSARVNQSRVQESVNASWLAKNVQPILALMIVILTFGMYGYLLFQGTGSLGERKEIYIYILGALTTISTQVVSYFFGSSQGSAEKNKALFEMGNQAQQHRQ